jgi:uncharacterized membrane protein
MDMESDAITRSNESQAVRRGTRALAWLSLGLGVAELATEMLGTRHSVRKRALTATAAVASVALIDTLAERELARKRNGGTRLGARHGIQVNRAITVNCSPEEAYRFWHDFQNLPRFMHHLERVEVDGGHSVWRAKAPAGLTVEWRAEIVLDVPNELIAWRALPESDVPNEGAVRFRTAPGERGTEVHVELRYDPPAGRAAALVAKLFGEEPGQQVASDLRRFKQMVETGDVTRSDASIHSKLHPARPSADAEIRRSWPS